MIAADDVKNRWQNIRRYFVRKYHNSSVHYLSYIIPHIKNDNCKQSKKINQRTSIIHEVTEMESNNQPSTSKNSVNAIQVREENPNDEHVSESESLNKSVNKIIIPSVEKKLRSE